MCENHHHHHDLKVAVVVGRHPYDVPAFQDAFSSIPEIEAFHQHMEQFVTSPKEVRQGYDVIVFYNFHMQTPGGETEWYEQGMKEALEELGETKQGILILHHALLAFPEWQVWSDITGIQKRAFSYHTGESVRYEMSDPDHPITRGIRGFTMIDETYTMDSAGEGSHILMTTEHPQSMKTIAWTRQYRNAPVFCYESGHDNSAFGQTNFRRVLRNGILWLSGKIC